MLISCFFNNCVHLKNAFALRKSTLKYLGVKGHHACNLSSNDSKNIYIYLKREKLISTCGKMLIVGEPEWREYEFFVLLSQLLSLKLCHNKKLLPPPVKKKTSSSSSIKTPLFFHPRNEALGAHYTSNTCLLSRRMRKTEVAFLKRFFYIIKEEKSAL